MKLYIIVFTLIVYSASTHCADGEHTPKTLGNFIRDCIIAEVGARTPDEVLRAKQAVENRYIDSFTTACPDIITAIQNAATSEDSQRSKHLYKHYQAAAHAGWSIEVDLYFSRRLPEEMNREFREYQSFTNYATLVRAQGKSEAAE